MLEIGSGQRLIQGIQQENVCHLTNNIYINPICWKILLYQVRTVTETNQVALHSKHIQMRCNKIKQLILLVNYLSSHSQFPHATDSSTFA